MDNLPISNTGLVSGGTYENEVSKIVFILYK